MALRSIVFWGTLIVCQNVNFAVADDTAEWCYDNTKDCGPKNWPGDCTTGLDPSPVNFGSFSDGFKYPTMTNLNLSEDCSKPQNFKLKNDGSKVVMELQKCFMSGGVFHNETYNCSIIVFHYGEFYYEGSEHRFKNYARAMEGQILCFNTKYGSLSEALKAGEIGAVRVFAVTFYDSSSTTNEPLNPFISALEKIAIPLTETTGSGFDVSKFIMDQGTRRSYYDVVCYYGSLLYPYLGTCYDGEVIVCVKTRAIAMTRDQMNTMRKFNVTDRWGTSMTKNSRDPRNMEPYDPKKIDYYRITLPKEESSSGNMIPPFPKIPSKNLPST